MNTDPPPVCPLSADAKGDAVEVELKFNLAGAAGVDPPRTLPKDAAVPADPNTLGFPAPADANGEAPDAAANGEADEAPSLANPDEAKADVEVVCGLSIGERTVAVLAGRLLASSSMLDRGEALADNGS